MHEIMQYSIVKCSTMVSNGHTDGVITEHVPFNIVIW